MLHAVRTVDFIGASSAQAPDCFISVAGPDAPTLVAIHGISRNAAEMAMRFAAHPAFARVNIVAPLFERRRFGRYQQLLARRGAEVPAHQALFALLAELTEQRGIADGKVMLFGFSGGAQMAHRLAMLHPERVMSLCAAAAGWYLMPDASLPYPYGMGEGWMGDAEIAAFFDVPTTVIVGDRDTRIDDSVRQDAMIVSLQGKNRLRRSQKWTRLMQKHANMLGKSPNINLVTIHNGSHDFGQCARDSGLLDHVADAFSLQNFCVKGAAIIEGESKCSML